jgi:hypothetical protein
MSSHEPVQIFTPEQVEVMHSALAIVCGRLGLRAQDRAAEDVAVRIVDIASTGICDLERLTSAVLAEFRPFYPGKGKGPTASIQPD